MIETRLTPWLTEFDFSQPFSDEMQAKYCDLKHRFQCAIDHDAQCIYWEPNPCGFLVPIVWPLRRLHGEYANTDEGRRLWAEKVKRHIQEGIRLGDPFASTDPYIQREFGGWLMPTQIRVIDFGHISPKLRYNQMIKVLDSSLVNYWRSHHRKHWRNADTLGIHVEVRRGAVFEYIVDLTLPLYIAP